MTFNGNFNTHFSSYFLISHMSFHVFTNQRFSYKKVIENKRLRFGCCNLKKQTRNWKKKKKLINVTLWRLCRKRVDMLLQSAAVTFSNKLIDYWHSSLILLHHHKPLIRMDFHLVWINKLEEVKLDLFKMEITSR